MAVRIGIELSPVACRIVTIDGKTAWRRDTSVTRVLAFAASSAATTAEVASLRGRRATVVVWGVRTDYRQVVVTPGPYERMRLEARTHLREAGLPAEATLSDIAPAEPRIPGMDRRSVLLASAPRAEVMALLKPLVNAGVKIGGVLLPAAALQSLARTRLSTTAPDALEAYVALEETASCIAVLRDGVLLAARDLPWGFLDARSGQRTPRTRDDIAVQLGDEIASLLDACRFDGKPLAQVSICGGLPELRSMTVPLMERLDVEVETLDSLFGIDPVQLPEPADEFRERVAGMRLAWAAAADRRPVLDLFRNRRRRVVKTYLSRAAVFAGAAAGLGVGWWLQNQWRPPVEPVKLVQRIARASVPELSRHATAPAAARAIPATNPPAPPPERPRLPRTAIAAPSATLVKAIAPPPLAVAAEQPVVPVIVVPPAPRPVVLRTPPPAPARAQLTAAAAPPPRASLIAVSVEAQVPRLVHASAPPSRVAPPPAAVPPSAQRDVRPETPRPIEETALPFDATLETILYGVDRKLAIVDGQIVQVGDEVKGARVVEITPTALLLRDGQGRLRRLSVSTATR